ncbi:hypothetical protein LZZ85_12275 [Terrimonas sp. NA20]|uniref:Uncharacterized protein n=1 Tax=Terrimonas ginsenosidimutans TaxID=2908004 RepID=A0ABS9KRW8_9BACT|nr:hypothetical protein [Terrimonas ginsenosidimutans]MCG2615066.1 hypothetical protein [Terrimonas ginsenosidimutans]
MKPHLIAILLLSSFHAMAQTPDSRGIYVGNSLEDIDLGWMNSIVVKQPSKPFAQHGWSYTAAQTDASQKIGSWIQQTYSQLGLLGELKLSLLAPEPSYAESSKSYDSNEAEKNNRNALPNTYGAFAKFHQCISKTATKKFWPTPGNHCYMGLDIMANNVQLISKQVIGLSYTDDYYCIMPRYEPGIKGRFEKEWMPAALEYRNFNKSPNLANYEHYILPAKSINNNSHTYVVIMTRDRKPLPFEQVTMGELISRIETQFPLLHKMAVNNGLTTRMPRVVDDAKRGFQLFKNKFKDQLSKYVYCPDADLSIDLLSFSQIEEGKDISWIRTETVTTGKNGWVENNFPLLRLKKGVKQALATGAPQWIVFKIDGPLNASYTGNVQMMDNFVSRFNYDYVYRYFFGNDKVIEPYKPLGAVTENGQKNNSPAVTLSAAAKKNASDKSILFFEDFSGTAVGTPPQSWTTQRSEVSGEQVSVTNVEKVDGNWLQLRRTATAKNFPQNINGDFELSYDLLVRKGDVPWGTPGIDMQLKFTGGTGEKSITLNVSPGDMNRADAAGWVIINGLTTCKVSSYYSLSGFTGSKPLNRATISLQRKGESVVVLCNNSKIYECASGFPAAAILKGLSFYVNEKNLYYLSNIQIRKL